MNLRRDRSASASSRATCVLRHAERLVPQPQLPIAEAVAGPLHRAQRRRPAELELRAIDEADERLARRAGGGDLEDLGLVVVVAHDVEVEVLAHVVLGQEGQLAQIVEAADVVGRDAERAHAIAVVGHVAVGVAHQPAQLLLLQLAHLLRRQPLRLVAGRVSCAPTSRVIIQWVAPNSGR